MEIIDLQADIPLQTYKYASAENFEASMSQKQMKVAKELTITLNLQLFVKLHCQKLIFRGNRTAQD